MTNLIANIITFLIAVLFRTVFYALIVSAAAWTISAFTGAGVNYDVLIVGSGLLAVVVNFAIFFRNNVWDAGK